MANILKRPMFRRGGSAAYNVGITSGLEPRKNYQEGTDPYENTTLDMNLENYPYDTEIDMQENVSYNIPSGDGIVSAMRGMGADGKTSGLTSSQTMDAYADAVQKRLQPTDKEKVLDYLTAFGATGGESPTSLRTFGSAFGKAAANYQNIVSQKEQDAKKAGADVYASLLKGSLTKEKLYLYQQQAQDLAKVRNIPYNDALKIVLAKELGAKDRSEDIIEKIAQGKVSSGIDYPSARAEAEIEYKITRDPTYAQQIKGRFKGSISPNKFMPDANGNYVLMNPQQKSNIRVNDVFVDPNTKKLYYFDGKKLVPTK
jgi:lysophospholipase L1-like esterase